MRRSLSSVVPTLPRSAPFRRLWLGQSASLVGSQVTLLALPLAAVLFVHATPQQMGYLVAAEMLPVVLVSVVMGVWVDRLRRRPLLIAADLARAVCVGSVPLAALLGVLRMEYLYVVSFCLGTLSVTFDAASSAFCRQSSRMMNWRLRMVRASQRNPPPKWSARASPASSSRC